MKDRGQLPLTWFDGREPVPFDQIKLGDHIVLGPTDNRIKEYVGLHGIVTNLREFKLDGEGPLGVEGLYRYEDLIEIDIL